MCERGLKIRISKTTSFHRWGKKQLKRHSADSIKVASGIIINCTNSGGAQIPDHQWPIIKATFIELGIIFYDFHNIWQV